MTDTDTYERILEVARRQFSEKGYADVTIRTIAASAGYSPAMVMKVMGNKEKLFALAGLPGPEFSGTIRWEVSGFELARRTLDRRDAGVNDPWAMAPLLIAGAPDPEAARAEVRTRYIDNIAAWIGDETPDRTHAQTIICLLLGFAAGTHTLGLFGEAPTPQLARDYGRLIQNEIDQCTGPRGVLPAPAP